MSSYWGVLRAGLSSIAVSTIIVACTIMDESYFKISGSLAAAQGIVTDCDLSLYSASNKYRVDMRQIKTIFSEEFVVPHNVREIYVLIECDGYQEFRTRHLSLKSDIQFGSDYSLGNIELNQDLSETGE